MFKRLFAATALVAVVSMASAGITASVVPYSEGTLSTGDPYSSWDLQVTVTGDDAWTVAGGSVVGADFCTLTGATFYQDPMNDTNPPNPAFIPMVPDSEFTTFYTTHMAYPNTTGTVGPGFAFGPVETPTTLAADWYWTPDGSYYPGTFTIARLTAIPTSDVWQGDIEMQIGSLGVAPFMFTATFPEPGSLALLALGGLALIRRR
jgi:hypothetical protein